MELPFKKVDHRGGWRPGAGRPKKNKDGIVRAHVYQGLNEVSVSQIEIYQKIIREKLASKSDTLVNAGLIVALGQNFVYRIDEEYDEDQVKVNKKGEETIKKGSLRKRIHTLVTDPEEIKKALDLMGVGGIDPDGKYYYVTTKEPDVKAIEVLLNRAFGRPKETLELNAHVQFSLRGLKQKREVIHEHVKEKLSGENS